MPTFIPMKISQLIQSQQESILQEWDRFISNFTPTVASKDSAILRRQAGAVVTFCASFLQSRLDDTAYQAARIDAKSVAVFFQTEQDYISLRLESGYTLKGLVEEIFVLRSALQQRLCELTEFVDIESRQFIALNTLLDCLVSSAMDKHVNLLKVSKQRFLSTINHDTRSPLFAISLGVRRLLKDSALSADIARVAQLVSKSAELAISRIGDYWDYTSIELGQSVSLTPVSVDMAAVCCEVVEEVAQLFPEMTITSKYSGQVKGSWDRNRIRQAIYIVLLNAIQSSEGGNKIVVHASSSKDSIVVDIVNEHGTIREALRRVIYDPVMLNSVQIDHGIRVKEADRNRMGLYLAREIINSHDGSLTIDQTDDQGIRFAISIPRNFQDSYQQQ